MTRTRGRSALRGSLLLATAICGLGLWQPIASAQTSCPGRPQLTCAAKTGLYYDSINWAIDGFEAVDLFEAKRPLNLNNPALAQFWRYEAATGITRYIFEFAVGNQGSDLSFETVPQAAHLSPPVIKPSGIVTGHMARAMSALLKEEQHEIVNLLAMDTALNRATGAAFDSRQDWASYQTYVAAGFARKVAAAMNGLVFRQHAVSRALLRAGLHFGVGSADQRAAQHYVRKHGWPSAIKQNMLTLGMNSVSLKAARTAFLAGNIGPVTFSLSQYLGSASVIKAEKRCAKALVQFADQTPAVPRPS